MILLIFYSHLLNPYLSYYLHFALQLAQGTGINWQVPVQKGTEIDYKQS